MTMASGGFRANAATDFLEEWKAKREKMRAKMLGDIAAATGQCPPVGLQGMATKTTESGTKMMETGTKMTDTGTKMTEPSNNGNSSAVNCVSYPVARSSSSSALRKPEDDPGSRPIDTACQDSDKESPPHIKGKEKKSSGPSARKGKGQIEKRKLREKRRSTGVVSIPSNESLDELDDDDAGEKEMKSEETLTQHNTVQNESMTSDPAGHSIQETPRRHKGDDDAGNRHRQGHVRHGRDSSAPTALERRIEELEKELMMERQENSRLLKSHQDKDDLIVKLKEEIDLLNRDLDDIEDENEQLKQENKTLLKVVGQLTR
ncbi:PRKC apoptosis WT1 regulator protein [Hoplias malabaricus]|uniref:PRKC apoptosis WT1 regulator protein n=1 Tax=Hoplias malabaricus TaxID=27720 RepID=UPI0034628FA8